METTAGEVLAGSGSRRGGSGPRGPLVWVTTADNWQRASSCFSPGVARRCDCDAELDALLAAARPLGVVWEIQARIGSGRDANHALLKRVCDATGVLLIGRADTHLVETLRGMSPHAANVHLSIVGYQQLQADVIRFVNAGRRPTPTLRMVSELTKNLPAAVSAILIAAIAIGDRRIRVGDLAKACQMPPRTLEWRLNSAGLAPARDLLGTILSLHTLWKLEVLDDSLKRVAHEARFRSTAALSNYVARHAGHRPLALLKRDGFAGILARSRVMRMTELHRNRVSS